MGEDSSERGEWGVRIGEKVINSASKNAAIYVCQYLKSFCSKVNGKSEAEKKVFLEPPEEIEEIPVTCTPNTLPT